MLPFRYFLEAVDIMGVRGLRGDKKHVFVHGPEASRTIAGHLKGDEENDNRSREDVRRLVHYALHRKDKSHDARYAVAAHAQRHARQLDSYARSRLRLVKR